MPERVFNFSAGPSILPEEVLRRTREDLWSFAGSGVGILEHSHRGAEIDRMVEETRSDCRKLANIPDRYSLLFLHGGASTQFFTIPANFLADSATADYLCTGSWSKKAIAEARRYGDVKVACSSEAANFSYIPGSDETELSADAAYVHFTSNNTIFGTQFPAEPEVPRRGRLICDMSSDIFSRPVDVSRYALVYAGAQKNLGPAGVTLVILDPERLGEPVRDLPAMLRYGTHIENDSRYNTPNVFGIYVIGQVLKWLLEQGGLEAVGEANAAKARQIYDVLDESSFFAGTARPDSRSNMNIIFRAPSEELEARFIAEAAERGLVGLKGHRSVGGMRASIYNAFPAEGCERLVDFMRSFQAAHG